MGCVGRDRAPGARANDDDDDDDDDGVRAAVGQQLYSVAPAVRRLAPRSITSRGQRGHRGTIVIRAGARNILADDDDDDDDEIVSVLSVIAIYTGPCEGVYNFPVTALCVRRPIVA